MVDDISKPMKPEPADINMHYISYVINHFSMIGIFCVQNSLAFLCVWEIMAITSFLLIIFEREKMDTLKAGINFLFNLIFLLHS